MTSPPIRFLYHAFAVGLAGEIRRPFVHTIDGQATCALPRYGGRASATAPRYQLAHVLGHGGVSTEVTGVYQQSTDTHETTASSTVNNLDLEGVVRAEVLTSRVHSRHPASKSAEPAISIAASQIQGLTVDGQPVELESWLDLLIQLDTMTKLREYYKSNAKFRGAFDRACFVGRAAKLPKELQRFFPWCHYQPDGKLPEHNGTTILPVFVVKKVHSERAHVYGNLIRIDNFGKVQLGELIVDQYQRRLMMLHADMGSPCEGCATASCSGGNGSSSNPPPPGNGDD